MSAAGVPNNSAASGLGADSGAPPRARSPGGPAVHGEQGGGIVVSYQGVDGDQLPAVPHLHPLPGPHPARRHRVAASLQADQAVLADPAQVPVHHR